MQFLVFLQVTLLFFQVFIPSFKGFSMEFICFQVSCTFPCIWSSDRKLFCLRIQCMDAFNEILHGHCKHCRLFAHKVLFLCNGSTYTTKSTFSEALPPRFYLRVRSCSTFKGYFTQFSHSFPLNLLTIYGFSPC